MKFQPTSGRLYITSKELATYFDEINIVKFINPEDYVFFPQEYGGRTKYYKVTGLGRYEFVFNTYDASSYPASC